MCSFTDSKKNGAGGFTLVELLVVIAIIGILVALLLPAVQAAREAARRSQCLNNMKQLGLSLQLYHDSHNQLPPAGGRSNALSWNVLVLPYLEETALFDLFDLETAPSSGTKRSGLLDANLQHGYTPVDGFFCPSGTNKFSIYASGRAPRNNSQTYTSHYFGVAGPEGRDPSGEQYTIETDASRLSSSRGQIALSGVLFVDSKVNYRQITDGLSNTFALGEIVHDEPGIYGFGAGREGRAEGGGDGQPWVRGYFDRGGMAASKNIAGGINEPGDLLNNISFASMHPGGCNFARCDGSAEFVSEDIDFVTYQAMSTRAWGDIATIDD